MNHTLSIKSKSFQRCSKSWRSSLTLFSRSSIVLHFTFKFVYLFFQLAIITPCKPHWLWYCHCAKLDYHSSVQFSSSVVSDSLWTHGLHHTRLPCPPPTPRAGSNSCPLSRWCHPTISSFIAPFSSCLQSFPASGSSLMSQFFTLVGQSIGASASAAVLPMNIQDWLPLGLTGWVSLQAKGLSSIFANTTVQKHQFFGAQLSL